MGSLVVLFLSANTAPDAVVNGNWNVELFLFAVALASVFVQMIVVPFYNKGESLHKDYWASGRINWTIAALEADSLIPALAKMFILATEEQDDKRRRPEPEIEALLQRVDFIPHLEAAQSAMTRKVEIEKQYNRLKLLAAKLWRIGLGLVIVTICLPAVYVFLVPIHDRFQWLFWALAAVWLLTLCLSIAGLTRFHSQIGQFNGLLEIKSQEET